jgi:hypothetical protein
MAKLLVSGILAGVVITIVSFIVNATVGMVWPYNVLELGGMRAATDPMMLLFFLHPWVLGFALSYAYPYAEKSLKGDGKAFGLLMWIVVSIPSAFLVYTSMNYPIGFTVSSVVGSLLYMLAAGMAIAWAHKK